MEGYGCEGVEGVWVYRVKSVRLFIRVKMACTVQRLEVVFYAQGNITGIPDTVIKGARGMISLFPSHSHRQYLIACSMYTHTASNQILAVGMAWERG